MKHHPLLTKLLQGFTSKNTLILGCRQLKIPLKQIDFRDNINHIPQGATIINVQPTEWIDKYNQYGTHWTCLYRTGNHVFYFDSFGFPPSDNIHSLIDQSGCSYDFNPAHIQNMKGGGCGAYCLWFLDDIHKKPTASMFVDFINRFDGDSLKNRKILNQWVRKTFK